MLTTPGFAENKRHCRGLRAAGWHFFVGTRWMPILSLYTWVAWIIWKDKSKEGNYYSQISQFGQPLKAAIVDYCYLIVLKIPKSNAKSTLSRSPCTARRMLEQMRNTFSFHSVWYTLWVEKLNIQHCPTFIMDTYICPGLMNSITKLAISHLYPDFLY